MSPNPSARLARIEPGDRLVVLARTINARDPGAEAALAASAANWPRLGEACLGQALYRHRSFFRNASAVSPWSHLELTYFRGLVPNEALRDLVVERQPEATGLLRAEILVTTPASFVLPRDWRGSAGRPERLASLEYIQVEPSSLGEYREVMRDFCGPAAAKLVRAGRFGTFRAMETAAVLYQAPELKVEWNQIHLCELEPDGFLGFGPEFEAVLREDPPGAKDTPGAFGALDRMRTIPCWTFNDPVVEADAAVAKEGRAE